MSGPGQPSRFWHFITLGVLSARTLVLLLRSAYRPVDCLNLFEMSEADCEQCRVLLKAASRAIIAHVEAISRMEEAVRDDSTDSLDRLERLSAQPAQPAKSPWRNTRTTGLLTNLNS